MVPVPLKDVIRNSFDRANLAVAYSAANRIMLAIAIKKGQDTVRPAFGLLVVALTCILIYMNSALLKNNGIQMTLSIVISNIITSSLLPFPEMQTAYTMFTCILFYLVIISMLCWGVHCAVKHNVNTNMIWEKIVPFLVLFASAIVLKIVTDAQQIRILSIAAIVYLVMAQAARFHDKKKESNHTEDVDESSYFLVFVDSVMCRSLVLGIQEYAEIAVDNRGMGIIAFHMAAILLVYSVEPYKQVIENPQMQFFVGVLLFTVARQTFQILLRLCNNGVLGSLATIVTTITLFLYNGFSNRILYNIGVFCLGIGWAAQVEEWISLFTNFFEHAIFYTIIFILIQKLENTMMLLYNFTEGISIITAGKMSWAYNYYENMMVIPHTGSTTVGLPYT